MRGTLTYHPRRNLLTGAVAGQVFILPATPPTAGWEHQYEFRPGKFSAAGHTFEKPHSGDYVLTSVSHTASHKSYPGGVNFAMADGSVRSGGPHAGGMLVGLGDGSVRAHTRHTGGANFAMADGSVRFAGFSDGSVRFVSAEITPAPGGPVPIPYPNLGAARGTAEGGGGDPDQPVVLGHVPNAAHWFDPNAEGGVFVASPGGAGVLIHRWPPRPVPGLSIVVTWGWEGLAEALSQTRQVTLVVEM